jgi:predicted nucleic acid-binding protein
MAEVFADTSGWAAFLIQTEPSHAAARGLLQTWQERSTTVVTTNSVLAELIALFVRFRMPRTLQIRSVEAIRAAEWVEVVHMDPELDGAAWALLRARVDKNWSLVDCASFVVMQRRGIAEALTTDGHFEQAGFLRLLS